MGWHRRHGQTNAEVTDGWLVGSAPYFVIGHMGYIWNLEYAARAACAA